MRELLEIYARALKAAPPAEGVPHGVGQRDGGLPAVAAVKRSCEPRISGASLGRSLSGSTSWRTATVDSDASASISSATLTQRPLHTL